MQSRYVRQPRGVCATLDGQEKPATGPFVQTIVRTAESVQHQTRVTAKELSGKETPATSLCAITFVRTVERV